MGKVLIVDDESGIRLVLSRYFRIKGIETLEAGDGEQALEMARAEKCSAVLLDMWMPGMDGLTLMGKLQEIDPHLFVVMMSGGWNEEASAQVMARGAAGFISKPFDFSELESAVIAKIPRE